MSQIQEVQKKFDWHLFYAALAVVIPIMSTIIGCYISLLSRIDRIDNRLTKIETVLILKGIMPKELVVDSSN